MARPKKDDVLGADVSAQDLEKQLDDGTRKDPGGAKVGDRVFYYKDLDTASGTRTPRCFPAIICDILKSQDMRSVYGVNLVTFTDKGLYEPRQQVHYDKSGDKQNGKWGYEN